MLTNLRGEMTVVRNTDGSSAIDEGDEVVDDIITSMSRALERTSPEEQTLLQELLIPTLFLNAVQNGDIAKMESLQQYVS